MSTPRSTHYRFAHQLLAQDALSDPSIFDRLEHQAPAYLASRWQQATGSPTLPPEVYAFPLVRVPLHGGAGELGLRVVRLPRAENATEAHYAAFVRDTRVGAQLRYFVCERSVEPNRAIWAEWRHGPGQVMRIRYTDLQPALPPGSGPVSTNEPFLDDFVRSIVQEVAAAQPAPGAAPYAQAGAGIHPIHAAQARPGAPPAKRSSGVGCIVTIVLLGVAGGGFVLWSQQRTRSRMEAMRKNLARVEEVIADAREASATPGAARCTADVTKRILAARDVDPKTKAPSPVPTARFVCDDGGDAPTGLVSGTCEVPEGIRGARFDTAALCQGSGAEARARLEALLSTDRPWAGPEDKKRIDAWEEEVDELVEELEAADKKIKPPKVLAIGGGECHTYVAAKFVSDRTGEVREVHGFDCDVTLTWVGAQGEPLGQLRATGRGKPDDSVANAQTLQAEDIERSNGNSQRRALAEAWTKMGKVLAK